MPLARRVEVVRVGDAEHAGFVHARHAVTRMGEPRGEVAVVGQDQQTLGVEIEPADRIDVVAHAGEQIDHRRTPAADPIAW